MAEQINNSGDIDAALKMVIRGLTQNSVADVFAGHRALFRIGLPSVPHIRNAILRSSWTRLKHGNEIRYVSGLVTLLHDIDEKESRRITSQLKRGGCDVTVGHILDSICRFTIADYLQYEVRGVTIFEHKRLVTKQRVRLALENWLKNIPSEDLQAIERIYVLRREDLKLLGNYAPILQYINLVWDNPYSRFNPLSWLNSFVIESTLYHEIGHHVHRHTFGQDPDQEKEAMDYSSRVMANTSRLPLRIMRFVRKVLD